MTYPEAAWERAMTVQEVMLKALSGELHWFRAAEFFEKLVAPREELLGKRGYTAEQVAKINRAIEEFRAEFDKLKAAIDARIVPALQGQFTALHRCCMQKPQQDHLDRTVFTAQFGEVNGYVPVDPEPMQKISQCACMVGSNQPGAPELFTGTLFIRGNRGTGEDREEKFTNERQFRATAVIA